MYYYYNNGQSLLVRTDPHCVMTVADGVAVTVIYQ